MPADNFDWHPAVNEHKGFTAAQSDEMFSEFSKPDQPTDARRAGREAWNDKWLDDVDADLNSPPAGDTGGAGNFGGNSSTGGGGGDSNSTAPEYEFDHTYGAGA